MSFLLPLAVACLLCPTLRAVFPDLAWFTGNSRGALIARVYVIASCAPIVAINSGGVANLAWNVLFLAVCVPILYRLARPGLAASDGPSLVAFRLAGFAGLCVYLGLLYGVTYVYLRPEGLPSVGVQFFTLAFYAVPILGLWLHHPREPISSAAVVVEPRELRLALGVFVLIVGIAFLIAPFRDNKALFAPVVANFVLWTPLGFLLFGHALWSGCREYRDRT